MHTAIHEVLHQISSEFDEQGHRTKNGLSGNREYKFADQINEGATDYLACKLSGEQPRNYIQGHKLFQRLEPMLIKYTQDNDVLMKMYLNNDDKFLKDFLNYFGEKGTAENLYENFLFMEDNELENMMKKIDKNVDKFISKKNKKEKRSNIINKIKSIFSGKKQKLLTDGKENKINNNQLNSHEQFLKQYNIKEFQSNMTAKDIQKYESYQQNMQSNIYQNQKNDEERE